MRYLSLLLTALALSGCTRAHYRRIADRDTYKAIAERDQDPRWQLPNTSIDPPPGSRLHDPFDPNFPPIPPDDPAAHAYMHCANGMAGYRKWHKHGDAPWIEDPRWLELLGLSENGILKLTPERAVELGILHSREYQTQLEELYIRSLALTLNRFEFALQYFGTNTLTFNHFGSSETETNTLSGNTIVGFNKAFAAGGQLMAEFVNSFMYQYAGPNSGFVTSNIIVNLTQPLLRGFGRQVRMEALTEGERNLLYAVRSFARFRKEYTFNVATDRYLNLLLQEQNIRNLQSNIKSKEQNYLLHLALYRVGTVSTVKVDQVFQSLQSVKANLISFQANLEFASDTYKTLLGLPPTIPIQLDDSILAPFQLSDPALDKLQADIDPFLAEYRQLDAPPQLVKLVDGVKRLQEFQERLEKLIVVVEKEVADWKPREVGKDVEKEVAEREALARAARREDLEELRLKLKLQKEALAKLRGMLAENKRSDNYDALLDLMQELNATASQLFVIETQVRVYLIRLKTVDYAETDALTYAVENRLDLMNQRGTVVDAWRQIEVRANALKAGMNIVFNANIATPPLGDRPFDFRASASSYAIGYQFDAPLNRYAEQNAYRQAQIGYQRERRLFMGLSDSIQRAIRQDLRQLRTLRLNFEISRETLISSARSVEQAREELLFEENPDPTSTQNTLTALDNLLGAKNALISNYLSYEIGRYQLLLDLEALQLDERGLYIDEYPNQSGQPTDLPASSAGQAVANKP